MDDTTRKMLLTVGASVIKNLLMTVGAGLVAHGVINSNGVETFVAAGMGLVGAAWSFWNSYGRTIVLSQLEVLKAKSLAQAAALKRAGAPPVTVAQIASQSPTMTSADVTKAVATLPADIQANVAKAVVIVFAVMLGALAFTPGTAYAQTKKRPALTLDPVADIKNALAPTAATATTNALAPLVKAFNDIAAYIGADIDGAVRLSIATDIKDGNGEQCLIALRAFGKVLKAHPVPATLNVAQDLEALRLLAISANKLCADSHCTQVFADVSNAVQTVSGGSIPVPTLNSLCSKVPQVAVAAPVDLPADMTAAPATTAPTPTPAPQ